MANKRLQTLSSLKAFRRDILYREGLPKTIIEDVYFTQNINITGQIKVWLGSVIAKPIKFWNGITWMTKPIKHWNGTTWIETDY